jgi:ABC-type antimicrobial peptide transport system permease subunit
MLMRDALVLAAVGLTIGIAGGLALSRWMSGELFGASPVDPISVAIAIGVVTSAVLAATWLPARRAARADAWEVLRSG